MALQRMDRHVTSYLGARESHFTILIRQYSLLIVFKVVVALGLLAIGGLLVMDQRMNIGQFVAAEIIILFVMSAVEKLVVSLETIYDVLTGLEKIGQVTDLALDEKLTGSPVELSRSENGISVQLSDVAFRYPGKEAATLASVNLDVAQGERLAITGANGSGKSTLLYVIAGLFDVQRGSVAYDNLPKGNLGLEELHSVIGDCLSQGELFEGTVLENIAMGRPRATFDNVQWAVRSLGLTEVIRGLPEGYDTKLNPTGDKLPRSTVQRLLLARAIADRPRLLLLENVFEAIDIKDRQVILDFLVDPSHPWTIVAVTTKKTVMDTFDRVVVLEGGMITEPTRH